MLQEPYPEKQGQQQLIQNLTTLSAREQIGLLLRASRSLSHRDRAEVLGRAGLNFFKDRFFSIFVHFFLKRVITGAIWWVLVIVVLVLLLILLIVVQQINSNAVTPVIVAISSYLAGIFISSIFDFFQSLAQFIGKSRSKAEHARLLDSINACGYPEKMVVLHTLSRAIANKLPGESLRASIITSGLLLVAGIVLIGVLILLSNVLPLLGSLPWVWLLAGCTFAIGFLLPGRIQKRFQY
ncbi:hypothetical protein KDA_69380 [Dictyobacter alpinus]|uniref:Uncharacterized protein n=1 Tax=Dictyobacter alpinus TaxID=2014873 RepID=A0A402BJD3_9CHLR|nr:hypothetical protein [Dictyobacter alpinus]GCE31454.1 hypothetical protein KDA_69380 [Dictyobacter alpinus]